MCVEASLVCIAYTRIARDVDRGDTHVLKKKKKLIRFSKQVRVKSIMLTVEKVQGKHKSFHINRIQLPGAGEMAQWLGTGCSSRDFRFNFKYTYGHS